MVIIPTSGLSLTCCRRPTIQRTRGADTLIQFASKPKKKCLSVRLYSVNHTPMEQPFGVRYLAQGRLNTQLKLGIEPPTLRLADGSTSRATRYKLADLPRPTAASENTLDLLTSCSERQKLLHKVLNLLKSFNPIVIRSGNV